MLALKYFKMKKKRDFFLNSQIESLFFSGYMRFGGEQNQGEVI